MIGAGPAADEQFVLLVHGHSDLLFRVAYSVLRHRQDAEDTVQDAFLKLYRTGAWKRMDSERAYLARMVWRLALDRRKARPNEEDLRETAGAQNSSEFEFACVDMQQTVHRLIDALPDELRQPLVLSALQELKSGEIGAILDLPDATVRNRVMRARQLLREKLAAMQYAR